MPECSILLVEDQPDDQFLTLRTLRQHCFCNVAVANEGEEALRFLRDAREETSALRPAFPELIILDLRMPKVDGFEFLEVIRSDSETRDIPVIVLTSSPQQHDRDRCMQLGVKAYLNKPLNGAAFSNALRMIGTA